MDVEWEWRFQELIKQKRFRIVTWCYIIVCSLLVDLPENDENWSLTPEFKNGPIARFCLIVVQTIVLVLVYRDTDTLINFKNVDGAILQKAKIKFYLYNLSLFIYAVVILSHETMDPTIERQYPYAHQEEDRRVKMQKQAYYFGVNHVNVGFVTVISSINLEFYACLFTVYSGTACAFLKF